MKTITIAGKLGRDAETRQAGSDSVTSFSVAVDSREKQGGQWVKTTQWFDVSVWGKRGEAIAQYLTKGSSVCASGDFGMRTYQAKDGSTKTVATVRASEVTLMGGKSDGQQRPPAQRQSLNGSRHDAEQNEGFGGGDDGFNEDEIPF